MESRKLHHSKRCLMVCAPTNKAVTVLCGRFLDAMRGDVVPCNAVLVGDDDKLLDDDRGRRENGGERSKLRSIFLYTFIDTIKEDYLFIRKELVRNGLRSLLKVREIAHRLRVRLKSSISDKQVIDISERILKQIEDESKLKSVTEAISLVDSILAMIGDWKADSIWHEMIHGADVIFCTLASSGASFLRKSVREVDDLIVDEAAAATEPEMYIPFQFLPKRLLAVGDPKQLPATVTSRLAERLGLSKSLHERLMYDCEYRHIMLDTQYRMKPELSLFPSKQFYDARLRDGPNVVRPDYNGGRSMMDCSAYAICEINGIEQQARSGSYQNEAEAQAVVQIVDDFWRASRTHARSWWSPDRLRIITFYQAQVSLIKRLLLLRNFGDVLVATVDSSQGCEADYVIVSFVRSNGRSKCNAVGFLTDDRRLNVAITRAKYQLICVGNVQRMACLTDAKAETVKRLACDAFQRGCVVSFPSGICSSRKQPSSIHSSEVVVNRKKQPPPGSQLSCVEPTMHSVAEPTDSRKRPFAANSEPRKRRLIDSPPPRNGVSINGEINQEQERSGEPRAVSALSSSSSSCSSSSCSSDFSHCSSVSSSSNENVAAKGDSL
jgi:superfamily I DNA and/or RNA helicase